MGEWSYYGSQICCASYAVKNLLGCRIPETVIELAASVPFGIKCVPGDKLHILTTFCDPNVGIEIADKNLNLGLSKKVFQDKESLMEYLTSLEPGVRVMVGPVDMGNLIYLPGSRLYKRIDHYIVLEKTRKGTLLVIDSEGIMFFEAEIHRYALMLSVEGVMEARNVFTVRFAEAAGRHLEKELDQNFYRQCLVCASRNLVNAMEVGEGPMAFGKCFGALAGMHIQKWKQSFLYDISYLLQRKLLFAGLLDKVWKMTPVGEVRSALEEQLRDLMLLQKSIDNECLREDEFQKLGELEELITIRMKEICDDWL